MEFEAFIHNDDVTCFHVAIQRIKEVVLIGCHNFKDEALIKRRWASQEMNGMGWKFKDENKWSNHQKLFSFLIRSCVYFLSFGVHRSTSVENVIEKLHKVTKEKEM
jgi:hypothetical protein